MATARSVRAHVPAIATCVALAWLTAVCLYAIAGAPASAGHSGPVQLVEEALGKPVSSERYEERSRPVTADVAVAVTKSPSPERPQKPSGKRDRTERRSKPAKKKPKRELGHTLPVAPSLVAERELEAPHHDYPALDIPLDPGTRVRAVTAGRVKATTRWGGCGKGVILKGNDRFTYTFCHGSKLLVGRNRRVKAGQGIMRSGNTGDSTGPHLHLQIRKPNGKLVCPQDLLPEWSRGEPASPWDAKRVGCRSGVPKKARKGGKR